MPPPSYPVAGVGRFAAGADPVKRGQILDGAHRVFMKMGYDAASMNDVTREAGVSKGTIYVYFQSKEDLFAALIERAKGLFTESMRELLAQHPEPEEGLRLFAGAFVDQIFNSEMIPAMRILLGVVDRMPSLCQRFFAGSPSNARTVLKDYLDQQVAGGRLDIDDTSLAATQFIELTVGSFFKGRLFNEMPKRPQEAELERVIGGGMKVFFCAYGPKTETV
ncbi:TetR/AcrR family transcriptional regulator [Rhizobium sp. AQ_MP]|uniref:TetR/AcrR family transcriptional regulator n=1 Tax=Rhizobium sp. AQ_MP TaxID=2761536 RepID=UPI0016396393|nr:TetR/AcrR family transcriptional regulator [Rhizobium sp. AQ_MP]MBC2772166.1 TetR/AcrR family transcriptional regulator [Rhizobium sp. AQ_MP]